MTFGYVGVLALAFSILSGVAAADTRALIVGVSGYPNLPARLHLTGPKNDSRQVANTLVRLGVPASGVTVLADGVGGLSDGISVQGPATREAILAALDRLADESGPGDLAVFYFSGHGTQQVDDNSDEEGGTDEIFLPYDAGRGADGSQGPIIVDDEFGERVERMLAKGVDFFGIIDACTSATGFRDIGGGGTRVRRVPPEVLGLKAATHAVTSDERGFGRLEIAREDGRGRGRAAFLYAAQEGEAALETSARNGEQEESYGIFTFNVLRRLNENPGLSYRRLHQAVVNDIKRGTLMATQTPDLEGTLLDEPALRLGAGQAARQWPIYAGDLAAGLLDGITEGTVLALFDDPLASDDKALARGLVETAGATKSVVTPIEAPDEAVWKKGRWARIVEPGVDFSLTLSEPVRIDAGDGFDYAPALAALDAALASPAVRTRVSTRASGFDMAVALVDGKLAFAPAAGLLDRDGPGTSPRLTLPDGREAATAAVASALDRMARALALQRMGDSVSGERLGLASQIMVRRVRDDADAAAGCPEDDEAYAAAEAADPGTRFGECDILTIGLKNNGKRTLDVTVLMLAQDFSITPVWPTGGEVNRLRIGEMRTADILRMQPDTKAGGEQRLVFIAVPGINRSHVVFDALEQEGLRGAPDDAPEIARVKALLAAGIAGSQARSAAKPAGLDEDMAVEVLSFREE